MCYLVGAIFGVRSFAPMLGFLLGAWTNTKYVDLTGKLVKRKKLFHISVFICA